MDYQPQKPPALTHQHPDLPKHRFASHPFPVMLQSQQNHRLVPSRKTGIEWQEYGEI